MKKIILTAAITLTAFAGAFAQKTADANLSVTINPIQTIHIDNPTVKLAYQNINDYANGVASEQIDHLRIYSTGAFEVKVSAQDLEATGTTEKIAASSITVKADMGKTNPLDDMDGNGKPLPLPNTAAMLFSSTKGGVDRTVNVTYKGADLNKYINKFFKAAGAEQNIYSTTVTYSIEAK